MSLINKNIEIVTSSVKRLSSMSLPSALAAKKSLSNHYSNVVHTFVDTEEQLNQLIARAPDLVFLCMKKVPRTKSGKGIRDFIWITDMLDKNEIPYTGSGTQARMLDEDKAKAKAVVKQAGLPTAKSFLTYPDQYTDESQLPITFPLFIKPTELGGGTGIDDQSLVYDFVSYQNKVLSLMQNLNSIALVEEYLGGREFTVAIIKDIETGQYSALPCELVAPPNEKTGARILSQQVKNASTERQITVKDPVLKAELSSLALDIFNALGARHYGRIDLRMNSSGELQFLEANLIPSLLKDYGNFPKLCQAQLGLSYDDMLLRLVSLSLNKLTPNPYPELAKMIAPTSTAATQYIEA